MKQTSSIASYQYTYGVESTYNRIIEFSRNNNDDPSSLIAIIKGKLGREWKVGTILNASQIKVEVLSASEKVQQVIQSSQKQKEMPNFEKKTIDQYSIEEQDQILKTLAPIGSRKIEIINEPGGLNDLEKVVNINVFDPS